MKKFYCIFALSISLMFYSSCMMVGLAVGASADKKNAKHVEVPGSPADFFQKNPNLTEIPVKEGTSLRIINKDSVVYEGRYTETKMIDEAPYLVLERKSEKVIVSISTIEKVEIIHGSSEGAIAGFLVGAAIDVAVVYFILQNVEFNIMGDMGLGNAFDGWTWY